jgi:hypothetical protein
VGKAKSPSTRTVERAYVDATTGQVHIVYSDAQEIQVPRAKDQVSGETPVVAPDHQTVGWSVNMPNCCTSYPIPTTLVIWKSGKVVQQIRDGMMI